MLQKFVTGSDLNLNPTMYEGHFTLKMFRATINKFLDGKGDLTNLTDFYACLLIVGLKDIYDEFTISDDITIQSSCKKCYLERKIPENYSFLIDQWEENGNFCGITPEDLIFQLSYNKKLTFDYVSAIDCLKLQPEAIYSIFEQILTKKTEFFRILPDKDEKFAIPKPSYQISGMDFPVLVSHWPEELNISIKNFGIFLTDEDNKVVDTLCLGNFPVYSESLNQRRNFFWRGGDEQAYLICSNYKELGQARAELGTNLMVRPLGETFVRSGWFMWGEDSVYAARAMKSTIYGVDKGLDGSTGIKTSAKGYNWFRIKDNVAVGGCKKENCVFSKEDILTIYKLINGTI
jgi:hypothetical protein